MHSALVLVLLDGLAKVQATRPALRGMVEPSCAMPLGAHARVIEKFINSHPQRRFRDPRTSQALAGHMNGVHCQVKGFHGT